MIVYFYGIISFGYIVSSLNILIVVTKKQTLHHRIFHFLAIRAKFYIEKKIVNPLDLKKDVNFLPHFFVEVFFFFQSTVNYPHKREVEVSDYYGLHSYI